MLGLQTNFKIIARRIFHRTSRLWISNYLYIILNVRHHEKSSVVSCFKTDEFRLPRRVNNSRDLIIATAGDLQYAKVNRKLINISETTIVHAADVVWTRATATLNVVWRGRLSTRTVLDQDHWKFCTVSVKLKDSKKI